MPKYAESKLVQMREKLEDLVRSINIGVRYIKDNLGLTTLQSEIQALEIIINQHVDKLNNASTERQQLLKECLDLDNGVDPFEKKAKKTLIDYLQNDTLVALKERAMRTAIKRDDELINVIEVATENIKKIRGEIKQLRAKRQGLLDQQAKLHEFESQFKSRFNRYADFNSIDMSSMLNGYLLGSLSYDTIWSNVSSNHIEERSYAASSSSSYSSSSDFSSGGFDCGSGFSTGGGD